MTVHAIGLPFHEPYEWEAILGFLAARAIPGVELVSEGSYLRSFVVEQAGAPVHGVLAVERESRGALRLTVHNVSADSLPAVAARVRQIFDLDAEPGQIADVLSRDPSLAPLVARHPGLRVPGAWDGFELSVRAILGQQISVVGATRLAGQLVALHGEPLAISVHEALTHVFPSPDRVASSDLSLLGMPGARRAALRSVAASAMADAQLFTRAPGKIPRSAR